MAAQDPNAPTDSNGGALVVTATLMLAISWLSVFLRSYVRAKLTKGFQADDWIMLAAQLNFTVSCVFIYLGVHYGLGHHNKALDEFDEIQALMYQALATATYISNMWLIKLSIALFLLRLATQKRYKYILWASILVVGVWSIALFFWNIFQCNPVAAQWDFTLFDTPDPGATCVSPDEIVNAAYALSIMTVLSDWLYALLPIPMIWKVKMTFQAKLTVAIVLSLGVLASIATLIRVKFLVDLTDLADLLHASTNAMVWTLVEPAIAIAAASLVTIRPLLRHWKIKGFGTTDYYYYGRGRTTTGRSRTATNMSRTHRSATAKMPGFGSTDVTLVDVEMGPVPSLAAAAKTNTTTATNVTDRNRLSRVDEGAKGDDDGDNNNTLEITGGGRRITIRSEMYVIEGASPEPPPEAHTARGPAWLDHDSNNGSAVELSSRGSPPGGLESPTRDDDGGGGLAAPRRAGVNRRDSGWV